MESPAQGQISEGLYSTCYIEASRAWISIVTLQTRHWKPHWLIHRTICLELQRILRLALQQSHVL